MTRLVSVVFLAIPFLLSPPASASCIDPAWCYCALTPNRDGDVLIRAEVLQLSFTGATLRVLGIPFHDPEDQIISGQTLEGLEFYPTYSEGDVGIFLVNLPNMQLMYAIIEGGGRYLCHYDPDFPGLNMEEMAQLVLSGDCSRAAHALGIESDCKDIVSGCCDTERTMLHNSAPLLLLMGFLLPRRGSRKAPKGRSM